MNQKSPHVIVPTTNIVMECGNCKSNKISSRSFGLYVLPQKDACKIWKIVCLRCGTGYNIDKKGAIGGFVGEGKNKLTSIIGQNGRRIRQNG